jgi:hypothetical protein
MTKTLSAIEGQLRECYGRAVYSHKTHEKCADILLTRLGRIKLLQIILSAITTGSFLTTIVGSGKEAAVIGIVVSTLLLVLNAYTKNYDLGELAQKHKGGRRYLAHPRAISLVAYGSCRQQQGGRRSSSRT